MSPLLTPRLSTSDTGRWLVMSQHKSNVNFRCLFLPCFLILYQKSDLT